MIIIINHAKTQKLKTMNIYYHTISMGQKFGSSFVGVQVQGFSDEVRMWARATVMQRLDWGWKVKMTHSHGHWQEASVVTMGPSNRLLHIFMTWQLTSPTVRDPSKNEPRGSCRALYNIVFKVIPIWSSRAAVTKYHKSGA